MTKNIKKTIRFLFIMVFCTIIAAWTPQAAKATETGTFSGAHGKSGDLDWNITEDGHLTVTGEGDYEPISIAFSKYVTEMAPEWLQYRKYICTADINVKNITFTRYMFYDCSSLTELDVSKFDTSNVTDMSHMFHGCSSLTNFNLNGFDTSNVTSMESMFSECSNLISLDLNGLNTSNVTDMCSMFSTCYKLTSLNLGGFDTSNVTSMKFMFDGCRSLTSLDLSSFDTSNVTDMDSMFCACKSLTSLDLSSFNTSNVTNMSYLFHACNSLTSLDISNFDDSKVISDVTFHNDQTFSIGSLNALKKIRFFANAKYDYYLSPYSIDYTSSDYRWIDENNVICIYTYTNLNKKMTYTKVDKNYGPVIIPTLVPTVPISTPSKMPTLTPSPSTSPGTPSDSHIFNDYSYSNPVTDNNIVIYGNGMTKKINGKKINNRVASVYTNIRASYKYTENNGIVKPSVGKAVVAVTKSTTKPTINSKNKVTDTSASKMAKAKIKNGQITVTAVGKEGGSAYLWVIDTGNKGVSACCPVNVKLAPKKLEIQGTSGSKLTKNTELKNGGTLEVCVAGFVGSAKTEDGTYTATVSPKYSSYVNVAPVAGSTNKFTVTAKGLKNDKKTKVDITFLCDQNNKKTKQSLVITK